MIKKTDVENILQTIPDPEIGVSIVDLGLVYGVDVDEASGKVEIRMTLTSLGCPLFDEIERPIRDKVGKLDGVKEVDVQLTFDPPWSMERMSEEAKMQLGFS